MHREAFLPHRPRRRIVAARSPFAGLLLLLLAAFSPCCASGAVATWTGGAPTATSSDSWNVASNWSGGAIPNSTSFLAVLGDPTGGHAALSTLGVSTSVGGVQFNSANGITLDSTPGAYTLTLGSSGITVLTPSSTNTINDNINITKNNETWTNNSSGPLTIAGITAFSSTVSETLTIAGSGNVYLSGGLSGTGGLTSNSTGLVVVSGNTHYSDNTAVGSGTLQFGGSPTFASAITDNGVLVFSPTASLTVSKVISGSGSLVVAGSSLVQLGAANTYTGPTTVTGGTLQIATYNGTGSASIGSPYVVDNGALLFAKKTTQDYPGPISGSGLVGLIGAGTLTLDSTGNTYTGGTLISQGTLQLTANNNLPINGALALGGTGNGVLDLAGFNQQVGNLLVVAGAAAPQVIGNSSTQFSSTLTVTGNSTYAGTIQDALGAGTQRVGVNISSGAQLVLTGTNTYSGPTNVVSGYLALNSPSALSTATAVNLGGAGTSGTLDLAGNTVSLASLAVAGGASSAAQIVGNGSTSANAILSLSGNNFFAGTIQESLGTGTRTTGVTITSGSVTLGGNNTYSGPTTVSGGILAIAGTQSGGGAYNIASSAALVINGGQTGGGTFAISSGGTLAGSGSIASSVGISNGATLVAGGMAGNSGTLSVASLNLGGGGSVQIGLSPTAPCGLVNVGGSLSLSGTTTVNVVQLGGSLTNGNYPIFSYGSLSGTPSASLVLAPGILNSRETGSFIMVGNAIDLSIAGSPHSLVWTGSTNSTWDTTVGNLNWRNTSGSLDYFANGDNVTLDDSSGSPANVVLPGNVSPGSLTVNITVNGASFSGPGAIVGGTGLTKLGTATLTISNTNSYTGSTAIQGGVIAIGVNNALSPNSTIVFGAAGSSGTLDLGGNSQQVAGLATANGANAASQIIGNSSTLSDATLVFAGAAPSTFGGTIQDSLASGAHKVNLNVASGELTLTGANTYSGATTVSGGTLQLGGASAIPSGSSAAKVAVNGTLDVNGISLVLPQLSGTGIVTTSAPGGQLILGAGDANSTFAGTLHDGAAALAFSKTGAGTLVLTGANVNSSTTTIGGGTLQVGNGGAAGSIIGNILDNATLAFNLSGAFTHPGSINGTGGVVQEGPGRLVLSSTNGYTGGTTIAGGTLALGVNNALPSNGAVTLGSAAANGVLDLAGLSLQVGSLTVGPVSNPANEIVTSSSINSSGTLTIAGNTSFGGVITDSGKANGTLSLVVAGGLVQLSGANSYAGITTVNTAGTLQINNAGASFSSTITDNGTLVFNTSNSITPNVIVQGSGTLIQAGPSTLVLNKAETFSGTAIISAGTLQLGTNGTTVTLPAAAVVDNSVFNIDRGGTLDFTSPISGTGSLAVTGGGTLILDASNTFTGPIRITNSNATLQIGNGTTVGSIANNNILVNCELDFDRPDNYLYTGSLSGTGTVYQNGAGTLNLQGNSSALSASLVVASSGMLEVSGTGSLNVPGTFRASTTGAIVLTDSAIVTAGKLVAKGPNSLTISGNASVSISNGNLQIGLGSGDTDTGSAISATQNGGSVTLSGSGTFIVGSYFAAASSSTGTYTQNAGTVAIASGTGCEFTNSGGHGIYNLNGGLLSLPGATIGSGSGALVLNGGTLQADASNASFIDPRIATSIGLEGAVIDTGSNAITISGNIGGASPTATLTLVGDGTLTLSGSDNTFAGGADVWSGTLVLQNTGAIADGSSLTVGDASVFSSFGAVSPSSAVEAGSAVIVAAPVPEPGTFFVMLFALALVATGCRRRLKR